MSAWCKHESFWKRKFQLNNWSHYIGSGLACDVGSISSLWVVPFCPKCYIKSRLNELWKQLLSTTPPWLFFNSCLHVPAFIGFDDALGCGSVSLINPPPQVNFGYVFSITVGILNKTVLNIFDSLYVSHFCNMAM